MKNNIYIFILITYLFTGCKNDSNIIIRNDFKELFEQYQVKGSIALFDEDNNTYYLYNQDQFDKAFTPASTFKIFNSLIGLETGVIPDENYVIPWDSINRNPVWDQDHDMKKAFTNSTVWYYQELARRVGGKRMHYWLNQAHYGNNDTSGGIDQFWLTGGLKISPHQQIDFLRNLYHNKLPFSQRNMDKVKKIMLIKDSSNYSIYGKTGWGSNNDDDIGWFVGYIKINNSIWYFSNCIQIKGSELNKVERAVQFDRARTEMIFQIFNDNKYLQKK